MKRLHSPVNKSNNNGSMLYSNAISSIIVIMCCMVCFVSASWAWFSSTASVSTEPIVSATYKVNYSVCEKGDETKIVNADESGNFVLDPSKIYIVTLSPEGTASTGYAKFSVDGEEYTTIQLDPSSDPISFELSGYDNLKADFSWGIAQASASGEPVENEDEIYKDISISYYSFGSDIHQKPSGVASVLFASETEKANKLFTSIPSDIPAYEGYEFDGWTLADGTPFDPAADTFYQDTSLYAVYKANIYKIRFFLDAEATEPLASYDLAYGTDLSTYVPDMADAKEGYSFTKWNVAPATVGAADADFIGEWAINKYAYSFIANGTAFASGTADFNSEISAVVPADKPTAPDGLTFKGWSATEGGKTAVTDFGKISTDTSKNTFYAIFTEVVPTSVNVTFYEYDGSNAHGPATGNIKEVIVKDCAKQYGETSEVEIGSALVCPEKPTLEYYTFEGWFDADGKEWKAGDAVPETGLVLYAKYARVQCGLIARDGATTVIERGEGHLNNLDDVASYTEGSYWYVYGLKDRLKEADLLSKYITVAGDCSITVAHPLSKNFVGTASTITVTDNVSGEVVEKFYIIIFGDLDGNGSITTNDESICEDEQLSITRWSNASSATYDPIMYKAANLDGKRRIGANDTSVIDDKILSVNDIDQVKGLAKEIA